jgi:hypothetical protein
MAMPLQAARWRAARKPQGAFGGLRASGVAGTLGKRASGLRYADYAVTCGVTFGSKIDVYGQKHAKIDDVRARDLL